jgi:hypothetical protein
MAIDTTYPASIAPGPATLRLRRSYLFAPTADRLAVVTPVPHRSDKYNAR